ncbi:hypothetical protein [Cupriavidus metallidurans]|uniref:hypothetical protein n=1 Tax=Cupriavidus metallidurans TaxID=119219 RepID=UPI001646CD21|nr:hypothetical protein [Cupriavidus metallidurans]
MPADPITGNIDIDREWFRAFQATANAVQKRDIREFVETLQLEMEKRGYATKRDEREEILIGAIARHLGQSQQ